MCLAINVKRNFQSWKKSSTLWGALFWLCQQHKFVIVAYLNFLAYAVTSLPLKQFYPDEGMSNNLQKRYLKFCVCYSINFVVKIFILVKNIGSLFFNTA